MRSGGADDTPSTPARSVLITGATSGIGRAVAERCAARGDRVVLVARSATVLDETATECRAAGASAVLTVVADVADHEAVEAALRSALAEFGTIDVCVHSAAVVAYGRVLDVPAAVYDRVVDVNVKGAVNVSRAALRHFESRQAGTLVLIGSLVGRIGTPYLSAYGITKWAIRGLARALVAEMRPTPGVRVCEVWPGSVNTPVYDQAGTYAGHGGRPPPLVMPAGRVADAVIAVMDRPRPRVGVGGSAPLMLFGFHALPWVYDRLVGPLMLRLALTRRRVAPTAGNVLEPVAEREQVDGPWRGPLGLRR